MPTTPITPTRSAISLFSVVNLARHLEVDPEQALRLAADRFDHRFRIVESSGDISAMSLEEMEEAWERAKREGVASSRRKSSVLSLQSSAREEFSVMVILLDPCSQNRDHCFQSAVSFLISSPSFALPKSRSLESSSWDRGFGVTQRRSQETGRSHPPLADQAPSAMFSGAEAAARRICVTSPNRSSDGNLVVNR